LPKVNEVCHEKIYTRPVIIICFADWLRQLFVKQCDNATNYATAYNTNNAAGYLGEPSVV
jgi:hypothetical protein